MSGITQYHVIRPRCPECKGRRVVVMDHIDFIVLVPCPVCSHRDPPGRHAHVEHVVVEARAA